jgi:hypothetical protein
MTKGIEALAADRLVDILADKVVGFTESAARQKKRSVGWTKDSYGG